MQLWVSMLSRATAKHKKDTHKIYLHYQYLFVLLSCTEMSNQGSGLDSVQTINKQVLLQRVYILRKKEL